MSINKVSKPELIGAQNKIKNNLECWVELTITYEFE